MPNSVFAETHLVTLLHKSERAPWDEEEMQKRWLEHIAVSSPTQDGRSLSDDLEFACLSSRLLFVVRSCPVAHGTAVRARFAAGFTAENTASQAARLHNCVRMDCSRHDRPCLIRHPNSRTSTQAWSLCRMSSSEAESADAVSGAAA